MLKSRLLSGVAIAALALGAGSPRPAQAHSAYNWTGFYLGLNAGGAWGRAKTTTTSDCPPSGYYCTPTGGDSANGAAVDAAGTGTIKASGFTGGLQAGYNWQFANYVYGLETDFGTFHLKGSRQGSGAYPVFNGFVNVGDPFTVGSSLNTDWLFTARGRLGWTLTPRLLAYATGGLALTQLEFKNSFTDTNTSPGPVTHTVESGRTSKLKTGWTVGGGVEWMLSQHWSVKGEYLFIDFGKISASGALAVAPSLGAYSQGLSTSADDVTAQIARLGVNYKF